MFSKLPINIKLMNDKMLFEKIIKNIRQRETIIKVNKLYYLFIFIITSNYVLFFFINVFIFVLIILL